MLLLLAVIISSQQLPLLSAAGGSGEPTALQPLIDAAGEGEVLVLEAGIYSGPVVIAKPMEIRASGSVHLTNSGERPAMEITADRTTVSGLKIIDGQTDRLIPAILVTGSETRLTDVEIVTRASGIQLREAHGNVLDNLTIYHPEAASQSPRTYSDKGNGIDLWGSHNNRISGSRISFMHDAIYIENSESNTVEDNYAEGSRYGYHFMFSSDSLLRNNIGQFNVTGAMIMSSDRIEASDNEFSEQSESVNSQGILLYDVNESLINKNRIEGNRTGVYVEQVKDSIISDNWVARNFIGVEMLLSQNNELSGNHFISNVNQAQSVTSSGNRVNGNYWDDLQGIDLTGQGVSSLSYKTDPFFLNLTRTASAYQLFFQSPGIVFLKGMFPPAAEQILVDESPLMEPFLRAGETSTASAATFVWGAILLLLSTFIIYIMGVKKQ